MLYLKKYGESNNHKIYVNDGNLNGTIEVLLFSNNENHIDNNPNEKEIISALQNELNMKKLYDCDYYI